MKRQLFLSSAIFFFCIIARGQGLYINDTTGAISITPNSAAPDVSAMLDIVSSNKGILIPRMTTDARDTIASPATGLLIYNSSTDNFNYYNGTSWVLAIGPQGIQGDTGVAGLQGVQGIQGVKGDTGVSVTNAVVTNDSLFITLSDGNTINAGYVKGSQGIQGDTGVAGADGALNAWGLLGSGGTVAGTNFIGTTDSIDLVLKTNNIERIRVIANGGKFGIGTTTPEFKLSLDNDGGILAKGTYSSGITLTTAGAGTRLLWYPRKAAFRVGNVSGTQWDVSNIGSYSFASGNDSKASGNTSTAMGHLTTASGSYSSAIGENNTASGYVSTAMGESTIASLDYSTAMGYQTTASGNTSTAMGFGTTASGYWSTSMGNSTTASGYASIATGRSTTASGDYSTAMGYWVSTNLKAGSFVIGDNSTLTIMNASAANEFSARFNGGYRLFSNTALSAGVTLASGAGAWASVSDKRKKENFVTLNAEDVLLKIKNMPITEWNYKAQNKTIRHIGPMAQDFYAAFKLSGIGNDTTITTTDIDGVNMLGIQALEQRTAELKNEIEELQKDKNNLLSENKQMKNEIEKVKAEYEARVKRLEEVVLGTTAKK